MIFTDTWVPTCDFTLQPFFSDKMFLFARSNKTHPNHMAPCKELCHLNKFDLRVQTAQRLKQGSYQTSPPSLPPPPSSFSSSDVLLWALSHHPFSASHSLTTPGNTRPTILTFRLIPFLSPCALKSSTFSSHRLIFLQHRFLSGPFPVQKCLLIPYSPFNNVQKSESQNKKL